MKNTEHKRQYLKEWRKRNPDYYFQHRYSNKLYPLILSLKDKPCTDCGIKYHHAAMDFDHLPQFTKAFNISDAYTLSECEILEEIAKCELVCANCHRIRTFTRHHTN